MEYGHYKNYECILIFSLYKLDINNTVILLLIYSDLLKFNNELIL